jgi:uncharacterized phage protein (predicted DNA packaging)
MNLEDAKLYLRIDDNEEDFFLQGLITAVDTFINNAVGNVIKDELYDIAMMLLLAHWYENRGVIGKSDALPFSFQSILFQLKYCGETQ